VTTAAAGAMTKAEEHLADMLADCPTFRTLSGTVSRAKARGKIFLDELPVPEGEVYELAELADYRPCAVIGSDPEGGCRVRVDSMNSAGFGGAIICTLFDSVSEEIIAQPSEAKRRFKNAVDGIVGDLVDLRAAQSHEHLLFRDIDPVLMGDPDETALKEQGVYLWAQLHVLWGRE
jgi:hypothetical protein